MRKTSNLRRSFFGMMDYKSASKTMQMRTYKRSTTAMRFLELRYRAAQNKIGMEHYQAFGNVSYEIIDELWRLADAIKCYIVAGYYI